MQNVVETTQCVHNCRFLSAAAILYLSLMSDDDVLIIVWRW